MTTPQEQLEQLRKALENGIIDQSTFDAAAKGLGFDAVEIKSSQVGVVGDHTTIQGDINFYGGREDPEGLLRRYLNDLAADTNRLPWGRISPEQAGPDRGETLRLSDVYTALDTTEPERMDCEDDVRACFARPEKMTRISAQQMIDDHDRLVLLGDPGSGKTTVVNFITHVMACAGVAENPEQCLSRLEKTGPWQHGPLLPVRMILREFAAWLEPGKDGNGTLGAYIRKTLDDASLGNLWPVIHEGLQDKDTSFLILLDGLDEVPAAMRQKVVRIIDDFAGKYERNRYLATCRIYAYLDPAFRLRGFRQTILAPFSDKQIDGFIDAWYGELAAQKQVTETDARDLSARLKGAIRRSDLKALAERPLIMTVMALLHTSHRRLPEDRVELYQWAVDLLFRRWKGHVGQGEQGLMAALNMPQLKISELAAGLHHAAFQAHAGQGGRQGTADISEEVLMKQLKPYLGNDWNRAETFIRYVRERSGLLIRHKPDAYTFPHRTFQEFMAACHLTGLKDYPREAASLIREDPDLWRIVFVLAAGHAACTQLGNAISSVGKLCVRGIRVAKKPDAAAFTRAVIAGEALLEIGLAGVAREEDGRAVLERVRHWLVAALTADDVLNARERVEAGNVLAQLGDPRFDPDHWYLPADEDFGFVGMTEDYAISKYPVTVAQFRAFVADSSHKLDQNFDKYNRLANHPVTKVSWHDAMAYCKWLSVKLEERGFRVTLPTEAQWERAARGNDRRKYPWGNEEVDPERANYDKTGIGTTSPVGCFLKGNTESGLFDMAGNIWEWCMDEWGADRIVRGNAWSGYAGHCWAAHSGRFVPGSRYEDLGFRLVRPPGQPGEPSKPSQASKDAE